MTAEKWDDVANAEWTVELTCGHRIDVPAVSGALATLACVREHRRLHHRGDHEGAGRARFDLSLSPLPSEPVP